MGLIDVLNGMQNGPRGQGTPSSGSSSGGGMSPITMAILGLLAFKALRSFTGQSSGTAPAHPAPSAPAVPKPGTTTASGTATAGGVGDVLKNGLGGLLAGGAAGSVLSGGLNDLLKQLQQSGQGDVAKSWVGKGPNQAISSDDLGKALGADQISALMSHSGLSQQDLLQGLSQYLPSVVDELTPEGRVPTEQEVARHF
jgi:uncharacterized protein YidB (DUF937 family)